MQHVFDTVKEPQKDMDIDNWRNLRGKGVLHSFVLDTIAVYVESENMSISITDTGL